MYDEPIPIDVFVSHAFQTPRISTIVGDWRVEPLKVQEVLVNQFREIGMFFIHASQKKFVMESLVFNLKHSKEIKHMLDRAERKENDKRGSKS